MTDDVFPAEIDEYGEEAFAELTGGRGDEDDEQQPVS
jgi:hypothetical protein